MRHIAAGERPARALEEIGIRYSARRCVRAHAALAARKKAIIVWRSAGAQDLVSHQGALDTGLKRCYFNEGLALNGGARCLDVG